MTTPKACDEHLHILSTSPDGKHVTAMRCHEDGTASMGRASIHRMGEALPPGQEYLVTENMKGGPDNAVRVVGKIDLRGPAHVATPAYRDGWDRIFSKAAN